MALEVVSGSVYRGNAKTVQKPEHVTNDGNIQESGAANISVTDIPAAAKTSGNNQSANEQDFIQRESVNLKQIKDAINRANNTMKAHRTRCEFSYHEETRRVSINVIDKETQEVIREIPPEEILEMIEKIWDLAGLLVDEKI